MGRASRRAPIKCQKGAGAFIPAGVRTKTWSQYEQDEVRPSHFPLYKSPRIWDHWLNVRSTTMKFKTSGGSVIQIFEFLLLLVKLYPIF